MPRKVKKRKATRLSAHMTRAMLLPMVAVSAQKVSLQNHMSLVALRQGHGNRDLADKLLETIYLVCYLVDEQTLSTHCEIFKSAESTLQKLRECWSIGDQWIVDDAQCRATEAILSLHDAQLAWLPTYQIDGAKRRLTRALDKGRFPDLLSRPQN
jgi:hypothetical protein